MTKIYLVCATGYDECTPMAAYTDKDRAELEAERVRKIRNVRNDSDGSCVYEVSLDSPAPSGFWMAWINEDGSWDETYFEVMDQSCYADDIPISIEMETGPGEQRQWRGVGKTEEEAKQAAMDIRDKALKNDG